MMRNYKRYKIWQSAVEISLEVYRVSADFPTEEKYGLTSQVRRCGVSIASNIAEGAGRNTDKEFHYFLGIAAGSCSELSTQLFIAKELQFLSPDVYKKIERQIDECHKMIYSFQQKLKPNKKQELTSNGHHRS